MIISCFFFFRTNYLTANTKTVLFFNSRWHVYWIMWANKHLFLWHKKIIQSCNLWTVKICNHKAAPLFSDETQLKDLYVFSAAPPSAKTSSSEEMKEKSDAMPNISDVMLRKLKLHRGLPGWCVAVSLDQNKTSFLCWISIFLSLLTFLFPSYLSSAPALTEKEVEVGISSLMVVEFIFSM